MKKITQKFCLKVSCFVKRRFKKKNENRYNFESFKKNLKENLINFFSYRRLTETSASALTKAILDGKIRFGFGMYLLVLLDLLDLANENTNNLALASITEEKILENVKKIVALFEGVSPDTITLDTSFYEDLDADSLDIIELTLRFEEAFKIDMAEEDSLKLRTVRDMCAYVKSKIDSKKTS